MLEKVFRTFVLLVSLILVVEYQFGALDVVVALFNIIVICRFYSKHKFADNFVISMMVIYMFLSSNVVAAFQVQSAGFVLENTNKPFNYSDFQALALFSNRTLAFVSFVMCFFLKDESIDINLKSNRARSIPRTIPYVFISVAFVFSFLRIIYGITDMSDGTLPYHLNGVIDEYNRSFLPIVMSVFIYDALSRRHENKLTFIIVYIGWAVFETFARVSKGAMVTSLIPSILVLFIIGWFTRKRIVTYGVPLLLAFLVIYPTIETLRHADDYTNLENIQSAVQKRNSDREERSSPFIRLFISGTDYMKVRYTTEADPYLFYFGRAPLLSAMNGSAAYMTYYIDGYSELSHQSSGSTGIVDPLLWGGYGFCYFVVVLLALASCIIDRRYRNKHKVLYYMVAIMLMKILIMQRSASFFIDELFVAAVVSVLLQLLIVSVYYKYYCAE